MNSCGVTPCNYQAPLPPHVSRAYTVNTILNESTSQAVSHGQTEFDTYLGFLTVDQFCLQYLNIEIFHHNFINAYSLM
jgi:hypothetical protein